MEKMKYVYGPVPSRRLGLSLGISPIPRKACNYSCVYCQLGRTDKLTNNRTEFFSVCEIINEFKVYLNNGSEFDVITIVGEGEPTLYKELGKLIIEIKRLTQKPVAVITNGALLYDEGVQNELNNADIVLPSLDAFDEDTFRRINRPNGKLHFDDVYNGLVKFSNDFEGQLWLETMIMDGINNDKDSILKLKSLFNNIKYHRLYVNTPVRPPAEANVKPVNNERMKEITETLGGISIENLVSEGFFSEISDDYLAILSIIKRHPMNQHEILNFLNTRKCKDKDDIIDKLNDDHKVNKIDYKGYITYRLK